MSNANFNRLDLLLKEITDEYVQENFRRLKLFLDADRATESGTVVGGGSTTIITGDSSPWEEFTKALPPSSTTIVDTFAASSFKQADYIIVFKDSTSLKQKSLKLTAVKDDGSVKDYVHGKIGSLLNLPIVASIVGSNYELAVTNSEAFTVNMSFARLKTT